MKLEINLIKNRYRKIVKFMKIKLELNKIKENIAIFFAKLTIKVYFII